jgi:hypothetical protein
MCSLVLFYVLFSHLGPASVVLLIFSPAFFALLIRQAIIESKQRSADTCSAESASESGSLEQPGQLKLTVKEKGVVVIGAAVCMAAVICAAQYAAARFFFIWGVVVAIALAVILGVVKGIFGWIGRRRAPATIASCPATGTKWSIAKIVGKLLFWMWVVGCLSPLLCALLSHTDRAMVSSSIRFPLAAIGGIAVDGKGRIYCIANSYDRIQLYDRDGSFIRGWFFPRPGNLSATVQLILDESGQLHVEAGYYEEDHRVEDLDRLVYTVFSSNGELLEKDSQTFSYTKIPNVFEGKDDNGNIYTVRHRFLLPRVVKISPSGQRTTLVSDPFYLRLIAFPFPSGAGLAGILIVCCVYEFRKKKKESDKGTAAESLSLQ